MNFILPLVTLYAVFPFISGTDLGIPGYAAGPRAAGLHGHWRQLQPGRDSSHFGTGHDAEPQRSSRGATFTRGGPFYRQNTPGITLPSAAGAPKPTGRPVYDATDFGAHGDNATDNTQSLQRALDAAHAAHGGEVYVPPVSRSPAFAVV